jgi:hypothetical protein
MRKYENLIYGVGAAIVIIGALAKIQHWPYGSAILTTGMIVEAGVFLMSAFIPVEKQSDGLVQVPDIDKYNEQVAIAMVNIGRVNDMYNAQIKASGDARGMSTNMSKVNKNLESLNSVYSSILKGHNASN